MHDDRADIGDISKIAKSGYVAGCTLNDVATYKLRRTHI
jgi:hypothetical protein